MEHCTAKFTAEFSSFGKSAALFFIIWACHHLQSPGALRDLMNLTKTLTQPLLVLPSVCCRSISFAWLPQHWWQIMCCGPFFQSSFSSYRMDHHPLTVCQKKCTYGFAMQLKRSSGSSCKCSGPFPGIWAPVRNANWDPNFFKKN